MRRSRKMRLTSGLMYAMANKIRDDMAQGQQEPKIIEVIDCRWLMRWRNRYHVSRQKPNKRYSVQYHIAYGRASVALQDVWKARYWFKKRHAQKSVTIVNADQVPMYHNEAADLPTYNMIGAGKYAGGCQVREVGILNL